MKGSVWSELVCKVSTVTTKIAVAAPVQGTVIQEQVIT